MWVQYVILTYYAVAIEKYKNWNIWPMAITMLMAGYSPKLKYLAHCNYNVNGRLQPKTEIFGPTGNVVQYFFLLGSSQKKNFFLLGRWYTGLPKKKNYMGCHWWVPEVSLSVQENLQKIQKRMLEWRFEHKTSLSETWEQRCLATGPTWSLFRNATSYVLTYFRLPIPSVKNSCCWWVP